MTYTIYIPEQITPETVIRPGAQGGETRAQNPEQVTLPLGTSIFFQSKGYSRFSAVAADRSLLLADPNGTATYTDIKAAFPGLIEQRLAEIRKDANIAIEKKWPLWAQINCANGIYSTAVSDLCKTEIAAIIVKSNTAEDAITNAVSMDALLAVTLGV